MESNLTPQQQAALQSKIASVVTQAINDDYISSDEESNDDVETQAISDDNYDFDDPNFNTDFIDVNNNKDLNLFDLPLKSQSNSVIPPTKRIQQKNDGYISSDEENDDEPFPYLQESSRKRKLDDAEISNQDDVETQAVEQTTTTKPEEHPVTPTTHEEAKPEDHAAAKASEHTAPTAVPAPVLAVKTEEHPVATPAIKPEEHPVTPTAHEEAKPEDYVSTATPVVHEKPAVHEEVKKEQVPAEQVKVVNVYPIYNMIHAIIGGIGSAAQDMINYLFSFFIFLLLF